jgi:3-oxoacyl-[acyl-carrier-protein] synthase II
MSLALADAGRTAADVDYVNLHGTSTVLNDRIETRALKLALGEHARRTPMSATKSQIGHPQGASGAAGLAAALCAINTDVIPPTINLDEPGEGCDLDFVPHQARPVDLECAMSNSFGFGGTNASIVLRRCE